MVFSYVDMLYLPPMLLFLLTFFASAFHNSDFEFRTSSSSSFHLALPVHAGCGVAMETNVCGRDVCSRPDHMFQMMIAPWKFMWNACCSQFKWLIIKAIIITLLTAMVGLFFYSAPGYIVKKILGA